MLGRHAPPSIRRRGDRRAGGRSAHNRGPLVDDRGDAAGAPRRHDLVGDDHRDEDGQQQRRDDERGRGAPSRPIATQRDRAAQAPAR